MGQPNSTAVQLHRDLFLGLFSRVHRRKRRAGGSVNLRLGSQVDILAAAGFVRRPEVRVGTFHAILQSKHIQLMTAGMVHLTNLSDTREWQPYLRVATAVSALLTATAAAAAASSKSFLAARIASTTTIAPSDNSVDS
jgi:hypothetical protein